MKRENTNRIGNDFRSRTAPLVSAADSRVTPVSYLALTEEWLLEKEDNVKQSTLIHYRLLFDKYVLPEIGDLPLPCVTEEVQSALLRKLLHRGRADGTGGLSPKTVTDVRTLLLQVTRYAHHKSYPIASDEEVFCPKCRMPAICVLTLEEQKKLETELYRALTPVKLGILTALYSGLRIGELCALKWGDFDADAGILHVNKTLLRMSTASDGHAKTEIVIDTPKTESSVRKVPLPAFLAELLSIYREAPEKYLLTGGTNFIEPRTLLSKYKKILEQAGLPSYSFHTLRHTFATRCVENEMDIKSLSEILGHANVSTTLQRYVHPSMELKREQMQRLESLSVMKREGIDRIRKSKRK